MAIETEGHVCHFQCHPQIYKWETGAAQESFHHGHFARGLVNSLSLLIGDEHGVIPVCAYDEDIVTTEQLEQTLEHLIVQANGDEVVIFTDLLGGSINNSAVSVLMRHRNVFVVAGINLTLLLEFLLCEEATTEAAIIYATSAARESIVFINPLITQPSSDPQGESHD